MAIPLLFVFDGKKWQARAALGLLWGVVAYGSLVWWLAPISAAGYLAFVLALALQGVIFALLAGGFGRSVRGFLFYIPSAWVVSEYICNWILGGFTWGLGYSQASVPELVQVARFGGVYAVSWLMVFFAAAVHGCIKNKGLKPRSFLIPLAVPLLVWATGSLMMPETSLEGKSLRVALIQANISHEEKRNVDLYDRNIDRHLALSTQSARRARADIIIWPETAFPDDVMRDTLWRSRMAWTARALNTPLLFGSALLTDDGHDLNALLMLGPRGKWQDVYYKRHLVPFTEYLPQAPILRTVAAMSGVKASRFLSGKRAGLFSLERPRVVLGATICSEEAYPSLYRELVRKGAGALVSVLNDGWFERPEALMLHSRMAALRAVETGRPLLRAANTGWTGAFDSRGRVVSAAGLQSPGWVVAGVHSGAGETFYVKFGDVFAWFCGLLVIIIFMQRHVRKFLVLAVLAGLMAGLPSRAHAAAVAQRRMQQQKQMQAQMAAQYQQEAQAQQQAQQAQQVAAYQQALAKKQYEEAVAQKTAAEYAAYKEAMQVAVAQKNVQMEAAARIQQMQQALAQRQAQEVAMAQQTMMFKSAAELAAYKQAQALKAQQEVQTQARLNQEIKQYAEYLAKQKAAAQAQMVMAQQQGTEKQLMEYAARQKAMAMQKRAQANAAAQADRVRQRLGKQTGEEILSSGALVSAPPDKEEPAVPETTVGINDLWEALDRSAYPWVQIVDREIKLLTVSEFIDRFGKIGVKIKRPPGEYVQMIDSLVRETPDLLQTAFSNLLSYAAIVEYDFDNGKNKDLLAREVLGEANYLSNKHRVQSK